MRVMSYTNPPQIESVFPTTPSDYKYLNHHATQYLTHQHPITSHTYIMHDNTWRFRQYVYDMKQPIPQGVTIQTQSSPSASSALPWHSTDSRWRRALPSVIRSNQSWFLRGTFHGTTLIDMIMGHRVTSSLSYGIYQLTRLRFCDVTKLPSIHASITGANIRYDAARWNVIGKISSDGNTVGISGVRAFGKSGSTQVGGDAYWVHSQRDYSGSIGIHHTTSSGAIVSASGNAYGWGCAYVSKQLNPEFAVAVGVGAELTNKMKLLQYGVAYNPVSIPQLSLRWRQTLPHNHQRCMITPSQMEEATEGMVAETEYQVEKNVMFKASIARDYGGSISSHLGFILNFER